MAASYHRSDIDGLRAVAILSVLAFHAFGSWLSGGFVGVDIFFVISGYLISGILLQAIKQDRFSFTSFYARRVKRIFPALALMLLVVWIAGWYLDLPDEYTHLGKHIAGGAGFVSNVVLWKEAGYFDQRGAVKPLLHLWSLGVEEQFYLLWPVTLFLAWKCRIKILWLITALLIASLALNVVRVGGHEAATFYLPITRLWELLAGAVYAYWEVFARGGDRKQAAAQLDPGTREGTIGENLSALAGLVLIAGALLFLSSSTLFPGWAAVPPVLGSALLIGAGPRAWFNRTVLSSRPMVGMGLISYPLYLWHWPLLAFRNIIAPDDFSPWITSALLLLAVLLAWCTYEFIERPVRSSPSLGRVALPLAGTVAAIGVLGVLSQHGSIPPRSARYGLDKIMHAANDTMFPGPNLTIPNATEPQIGRQGTGLPGVLFVGDSFIQQYYPRVDWLLEHAPARTKSVVYATDTGCAPIPDVLEDHHPYCVGLTARALRFAADPDIDTVVIGANWMVYFLQLNEHYAYYFREGDKKEPLEPGSRGSALAWDELRSTLEQFRRNGKRVYLILQSPVDPALNPRRMVAARWGSRSFQVISPTVARTAIVNSIGTITQNLRAIAAATGAQVIDPIDSLCSETCLAMTSDGRPVYQEGEHLSPDYVRTDVHYLDNLLRLEPNPSDVR